MTTLKTQVFVDKSEKIHGNKYDYSKTIYHTAKTKVAIICSNHGEFSMTPNNHLSGYGCPKCAGRGFSNEDKLNNFIIEANRIHKNKYDYSLVNIADSKYIIICPEHGKFKQSKIAHITNKSGCPTCGKLLAHDKTRLSKDKFIEKSNLAHNHRYQYEHVIYKNAHTKVNITCPIHGNFSVTPANHWSNGVGCPSCLHSNPSKGETKIYNWLISNHISVECQKTFGDLYYKSKNGRLKYDFYLPDHNLLIEFDGEYHYNPITFSKSITKEDQLILTKIRDQLKTDYAKNNGFDLLRIRFDDDIIAILTLQIQPMWQNHL